MRGIHHLPRRDQFRPEIRKRPSHSGYATIAAGLAERFRGRGPWSASELTQLGPSDLGAVTGQDPDLPLMEQYAVSLRDVGEQVLADYGGRFESVVDAAGGSAVALAHLLAEWEAFADVSTYQGQPVPFYKRAQIAAADIDRTGVAALRHKDRLTAFADNLVPHVLRLDGVLWLDPGLEAKIEAGELLVHGSPEEVELRACAVHAVELLSAVTRLSPAEIDGALWNRGHGARYKSAPDPVRATRPTEPLPPAVAARPITRDSHFGKHEVPWWGAGIDRTGSWTVGQIGRNIRGAEPRR